MAAVVTGEDENGEKRDITIRMKLSMSDVGTTVPEAPPENYTTMEYYEETAAEDAE